MLKLVHEYFSKAKEILSKGNFSHDCSRVFEKCSDSKGKSTISPGNRKFWGFLHLLAAAGAAFEEQEASKLTWLFPN